MFSFPSLHQHAQQAGTHASLMGQREVPLLGDYEAAWHLGEGQGRPALQPEQGQADSARQVNECILVSSWVNNRTTSTSPAFFHRQPAHKILEAVVLMISRSGTLTIQELPITFCPNSLRNLEKSVHPKIRSCNKSSYFANQLTMM